MVRAGCCFWGCLKDDASCTFRNLWHESSQLQVQISNQSSEPVCSRLSGVEIEGPEAISKGCLVFKG